MLGRERMGRDRRLDAMAGRSSRGSGQPPSYFIGQRVKAATPPKLARIWINPGRERPGSGQQPALERPSCFLASAMGNDAGAEGSPAGRCRRREHQHCAAMRRGADTPAGDPTSGASAPGDGSDDQIWSELFAPNLDSDVGARRAIRRAPTERGAGRSPFPQNFAGENPHPQPQVQTHPTAARLRL